jgi:pimeloyl-ACP methyl ester carboxylesterase
VKLAYDRGGDGPNLLVLLHGLGASRQVWTRFIAAMDWPGSWVAPDFRGHGASPHASSYAMGLHASDVGELVLGAGKWDNIVLLGHSMGGSIAIALGSGWFGIAPSRVFGLGIKVEWNSDEQQGLKKAAALPVREFATRDEAVARYLKVSGLAGLVAPGSPEATSGVVSENGHWRLAADPATASIGPPPMQAMMSALDAPHHLARGETDALLTLEQITRYDPQARNLPGGHNAMVENPKAAWDWVAEKLA